MTKTVIVDTDVMVDFLRGADQAVVVIKEHAERIALSPIVVAELYAGVKGKREQETLDELVSIFRVINVTAEIAKSAGLLKRDYAASHGVGLADAVIAATARSQNAELLTLNVKHYPMLKSLEPAYEKK